MYTAEVSELMYPLAYFNSDSYGVGVHNSGWVSLSTYHRAFLVLNVGEMQAGATLDCALQQATTGAGAGAKAITSAKAGTGAKAITQLVQALGDGDDLVCIELQTEELDVNNRFHYVRFQVTIAGAAVECSAILYGCVSRFKPVPVANWTEIVD